MLQGSMSDGSGVGHGAEDSGGDVSEDGSELLKSFGMDVGHFKKAVLLENDLVHSGRELIVLLSRVETHEGPVDPGQQVPNESFGTVQRSFDFGMFIDREGVLEIPDFSSIMHFSLA